ncbi:MAG: 4-amino-4-deoxychorismate lyase [Synechococcus sp. TMED90]|nr:MAG: 4-amino-4-deoxychorismate lyase [Synechococcus sp. TMED90]
MSAPVLGWINGHLSEAKTLGLPLTDRGLQLADGLFETVLVLNGDAQLLDAHLQRWQHSAALLGMAPPPSQSWLHLLIQEGIAKADLNGPGLAGALRLNWSRGQAAERGIGLPPGEPDRDAHCFWLTLQRHHPCFTPAQAWISVEEQRNASSRLSRCKTFAYGQAIQARREAQTHGAELALLRNTSGELCCSDSANLLVRRQGQWITPPLSSGCLPGVMRARALELGLAVEAHLGPDLQTGDLALLINSLSCRPLQMLNAQALQPCSNPEQLWRELLQA